MSPSDSAPSHPRKVRHRRPWWAIVAFLLVGVAAAQYLAGYALLWSLHHDPRAATPLTWLRYAVYFRSNAALRARIQACGAMAILLSVGTVLIALLPRARALHGDARFARRHELRGAGLFAKDGVILGRWGSRFLILPGQQSVILAAPPRSGKGVGVVIPNALNWAGSLVVTDIKRENWTITAGFRRACGQACYLFDPLAEDGRTARWNCLSYVSAGSAHRINDIQRIADILYAEAPGADPFWVASARSLFLGICLYLFETASLPKTMGEIRRQGMASDDEGFGAHWKRIVAGRQSGHQPLSAECVRALYDVIDLAPVTASSVRKTFTSRLDLWANPLLDLATSGDDFDVRELRKRPMSIYVAVNPDDLHRLRPVLSLFFQQTIGLQTRETPERNPALRYQLLMLLDEFTALGRIPIVSEAMAYLPGYNVRVLMIIQAFSQLREVYGLQAAETMLKSVAVRIVFAPKDYPDAKEISDELGMTTVKVASRSRPSGLVMSRQRQSSTSVSEQARALLLPQEVKEIGTDTAIVFYEGLRPIRCQKIRYYADRRFVQRLLPPPAPPRRREAPTAPACESRAASHLSPTNPCASGTLGAAAPPMRPACAQDIDRLESLTLKDFGVSIQNLTFKHAGDRPTESEFDADVDQLMSALGRRV